MQRTQRVITMATLGLAATVTTIAVLNPVETTPQVTGPIGAATGLPDDPAGEYADAAPDTPVDTAPARPVITLGDLDPASEPAPSTK